MGFKKRLFVYLVLLQHFELQFKADISKNIGIGKFEDTGRGVKAEKTIYKGETIMAIKDVFNVVHIVKNSCDIDCMLLILPQNTQIRGEIKPNRVVWFGKRRTEPR